MMKLRTVLGLAIAACLSNPAQAIVLNATVDPSSFDGQTNFTGLVQPLDISPASVSVGDMVDQTVNFTSGLRVRMFDDDGGVETFDAWMQRAAGAAAGNFTISNITLDLLGLDGVVQTPLVKTSETTGSVHLGPRFWTNIVAMGESIAFTGYRVQYTVDALPADPNSYSDIWFNLGADRFTVEQVPEPTTLALMGLGLVGIGWRRKVSS